MAREKQAGKTSLGKILAKLGNGGQQDQ